MAAPTTNLDRTRTVTVANPTPPTNVVAYYQGTPPTPAGLAPTQTTDPDMTDPWVIADPINGAAAPDLAGKAEADGTEVETDVGTTTGHSVLGDYSESPNTNHPSGSGIRQPLNTALPTITGTPVVGQVLTAVPGTWEGTATITLAYSWQDETDTELGTGPTLTLLAGHVGKQIKVVESATNDAGTVSAASALTDAVTLI